MKNIFIFITMTFCILIKLYRYHILNPLNHYLIIYLRLLKYNKIRQEQYKKIYCSCLMGNTLFI